MPCPSLKLEAKEHKFLLLRNAEHLATSLGVRDAWQVGSVSQGQAFRLCESPYQCLEFIHYMYLVQSLADGNFYFFLYLFLEQELWTSSGKGRQQITLTSFCQAQLDVPRVLSEQRLHK